MIAIISFVALGFWTGILALTDSLRSSTASRPQIVVKSVRVLPPVRNEPEINTPKPRDKSVSAFTIFTAFRDLFEEVFYGR